MVTRGIVIIPYSERAVFAWFRGSRMSPALQRPHVLIVSDDAELVGFLGEGLIYAGFWTSTIASALQTLEVFRLRSFDIVILDAALGGIGALELVRRLRGHADRSQIGERTDVPILVIAGLEREIAMNEELRATVDQVLVAPIEIEVLAADLDRIVTHWRRVHPERRWADEAAFEKR